MHDVGNIQTLSGCCSDSIMKTELQANADDIVTCLWMSAMSRYVRLVACKVEVVHSC